MSKIAIVYWSGTGNTEKMANYVADGAKESGAETEMLTASKFTGKDIDNFDAIAFGCPSMGAEVLEESEFQPMWDIVEPKLNGKKIALFGSYGWGDGEWMRDWESACEKTGAVMACDFVICQEEPDSEAEASCKELGKSLSV